MTRAASNPSIPPEARPGTRAAAILRSMLLAGLVVLLPTSLRAATPEATTEPGGPDYALIAEAVDVIEQHFVDVGALDPKNLTEGAIRGIVDALGDDGHSTYLTADELQAEQDALDGRVSGVGVVIDRRGGAPVIISVLDGSPADLAGIRSGDLIVKVDGADVSRVPVDELVNLVRGDIDTVVRLGVERLGVPRVIERHIVRKNVEIEPVSWAFVPGTDIAVVRIVQFSAPAGQHAREAVESVLDAGASGIVLDLRGNPGGFVDEALQVASVFMSQGVAYQERGRDGQTRKVPLPTGQARAPDTPLVVLVDYGTASSAEILAASLRDNGRATIVGEQTFGTGTVLNTFSLSDGSALRLGVLDWLTPSGKDVFRVGVAPDEVVRLPPGSAMLDSGDLIGMTASEFDSSGDLPLQQAVADLLK